MTSPQPRSPSATAQQYEPGTVGGQLRVGCAMWAHKQWPGRHLPVEAKSGAELPAYATWCTAVEGNTTFYATPPATTVSRWAKDTPDGFQFCFKLPRAITHERRLRDVADLTSEFLDRIAPMAERLGPIQIQLPPSFSGADLPALAQFLEQTPTVDRATAWAVELRHPDFFVGGAMERTVDDLLIHHGANRVVLDSRALFDLPPKTPEEHDAWDKKPQLPVRPMATARQPIIRLIGSRDLDASLDRWQQWVPVLVRWLSEGRSPVVFAHTPDNVDAPPLARQLHSMVSDAARRAGIVCPPLPEPATAGVQLDLLGAQTADPRRVSHPVAADPPPSG